MRGLDPGALAQASPTALHTQEGCIPLCGHPITSGLRPLCCLCCEFLQAGDVRTSIGSGLLQLGIQSKASVGIYGINCKGAATDSRQGGSSSGATRNPWTMPVQLQCLSFSLCPACICQAVHLLVSAQA